MNGWLLFPTSAGVLYVGGQIMALVFRLIDSRADSEREAVSPDKERERS